MMLELANMHHRMKLDAGCKLQTNSNRIDDLSNAIRSSPLGSQLPGESPSELKVISLQPSKVPKQEGDVPAVLVCIAGHVSSGFGKMLLDLGVN